MTIPPTTYRARLVLAVVLSVTAAVVLTVRSHTVVHTLTVLAVVLAAIAIMRLVTTWVERGRR